MRVEQGTPLGALAFFSPSKDMVTPSLEQSEQPVRVITVIDWMRTFPWGGLQVWSSQAYELGQLASVTHPGDGINLTTQP